MARKCVVSKRCHYGLHGFCRRKRGSCACSCHTPVPWPGMLAEIKRRRSIGERLFLGKVRYELRHARALRRAGRFRWVPTLRAWWWRFVVRYECEICQDCGCGGDLRVGASYWGADDALWLEVMGSPHGVLCLRCFANRCDDLGISVKWVPTVQHRRRASATPGALEAR